MTMFYYCVFRGRWGIAGYRVLVSVGRRGS